MKEGLKQKIDKNAMLLCNVTTDFTNSDQCLFPSGLIAHKNSEVMLTDDVVALLDEVAKQIQEIIEDMQHIPSRRLPLGKNAWLQEWNEVIDKLKRLVVLDGEH